MTTETIVRAEPDTAPAARGDEQAGRGRAPRDRRRTRIGLLLMAPAIVAVLGLAIVPIVLVARNSFAESNVYGGITGGFTFDNYAQLFDPAYGKVLGYSLVMALINTVVCLVVGYIVSYYIVSRPPQRQSLLLLLIIVPFWTDFLVRTFAWISVLGRGGPVYGVLGALGVDTGSLSLIPSQGAVVMGLLYAFLPTAIFPIYASMRAIDPSVKEAAADLGCGWWQTHFRVLIPLSSTGIVAAAMLTFVPTLGVFVIPVLLGGGKDQLVGNLIVTLYTEFRNQPMGAAVSMVLLVLMLVAMAVAGLIARRGRKRVA
ncbi:ABC transporter permease [Leifsonia sp. 21MFCrub1.1]|uniref:ABC transporter permease n=1 Tax=Leifsonia sp. 21MFCrub1.1 TaxID=1798223 RepID=UPI00089281D5|nr:ABC transporter permease [Leifsonia sp. 21MFCrub1.1]SEB07833.1 spermidine/putrescine transport system permease protein [Leifsonia sp. 21MFCrub1.1]